MPLVLVGTVVPLAPNAPDDAFSGRVVATKRSGQAAPAGFADAPLIDFGDAYISPGLVDLHSHIGYASLPLWTEPSQTIPFRHPAMDDDRRGRLRQRGPTPETEVAPMKRRYDHE